MSFAIQSKDGRHLGFLLLAGGPVEGDCVFRSLPFESEGFDLRESEYLPFALGEYLSWFVSVCGEHKDLVCLSAGVLLLPGFFMGDKARRYYFMLTLGTTVFLSVFWSVVETPVDAIAEHIEELIPESR